MTDRSARPPGPNTRLAFDGGLTPAASRNEVDVDHDRGAFGPLLRRLRLSARMSQEELAERARLSVEAISALERGRRRAPYRETIRLLGDALALPAAVRTELEAAARQKRPPFEGAVKYDSTAKRGGSEESRRTLARPLSSFHNRVRELAELQRLLAGYQLISLIGPGGIGKTRLALQLALAVEANYSDGAWFVDLSPLGEKSLVSRTLLATLGIKQADELADLDTLAHHLRERDALIVLDNCELVIEQIAVLAQTLLETCYKIRIVTTTREPLNISGERVYRIPTLESPAASISINAATGFEFAAVQLFVDRAQATNSAFIYSDATAQTVAAICRRLDGIALAIELAASRAAMLSPAGILEQLENHFDILTGGNRTGLARQRTMHETIRWSYDRLNTPEQRLFRLSAIFYSGFTLEALETVAGVDETPAVFDTLTSLVEKSLVVADTTATTTRFRLLEPIRDYALTILERAGERSHAQSALARWCQKFVDDVHAGWATEPSAYWSMRAEADLDNLRGVLQWLLEDSNDVATGCRIVATARRLWARLCPSEGKRWINKAQHSANRDNADERMIAELALAEAHVSIALEQYQTALAAALACESKHPNLTESDLAEVRGFMGLAMAQLGDYLSGETLLQASIDIFSAGAAPQLHAYALNALGIALFVRGQLNDSRSLFRNALRMFQQLGNERGIGSVAANLAEIEYSYGNVEDAASLAENALAAVNSGREGRLYRANLAAYLIRLGRYERAAEMARESVLHGGLAREDVDVAFSLQHLAAIVALRPPTSSRRRRKDLITAVQVIGFIDFRLETSNTSRQFTERHEYDALIAALELQIEEERFEQLYREGRSWTEDDAIREILISVDDRQAD